MARVDEQPQRREFDEPAETLRPLPWYLIVFIVLVTGWALWIVFATPSGGAARYGDQRTLSMLAAEPPRIVDGSQIFSTRCAACHQAQGEGVAGAFPPLAGSEWVVADPQLPLAVLLKGLSGRITVKGQAYNGAMPSWEALSDAELAAVLTFVRQDFGNHGAQVMEKDVRAARERWKSTTSPFAGAEALTKAVGESP